MPSTVYKSSFSCYNFIFDFLSFLAHAQTERGGPAKDFGGALPHRDRQKLQCPLRT